MGSMTNLLLRDDNNADVTFKPVLDGQEMEWREVNSSIAAVGLKRLRLTVPPTFSKNGVHTSRFELHVPFMETPNGAAASGYDAQPKVAHFVDVSLIVHSHERATSENVADVLRMATHALSGAAATTGYTLNPATGVADSFRDTVSDRNITYAIVNRVPLV